MKIGPQPDKWLRKKARQGMRGYPVGTIAFYDCFYRRPQLLYTATYLRNPRQTK